MTTRAPISVVSEQPRQPGSEDVRTITLWTAAAIDRDSPGDTDHRTVILAVSELVGPEMPTVVDRIVEQSHSRPRATARLEKSATLLRCLRPFRWPVVD